jgi:hypothetical protein
MKRALFAAFVVVLVTLGLALATMVPASAESVPTVWTDKPDYAPEETVIIAGSGFADNVTLTVRVTRPDSTIVTGDGTFRPGSDNVTTDTEGGFTYEYILDGVFGLYSVDVLSGDSILATTTFTDGPKVGSVTVGAQSGTLTYGTAGSATYTITVNRGSGGGSSGAFTADLGVTTTMPTGATATFSPNPVSFTPGQTSRSSTLTITTTNSTPAGATSFTVKAWTSDKDYAEANGTLTVGKGTPIITWSNPADIVYGTVLSGTQLDATASVAGTFVYTPSAGTSLSAGSNQNLHVDLTPTDTANYNNASKDVKINVTKADATIVVSGYTGVYDGDAHGATGTATGVKLEALLGLDLGASFTNVPGGTANWTFTDVTGNYKDDSGSVEIAISKAVLTVTAANKSMQYSDPVPAFTYTYSGFVGGETLGTSGVTGEPSFSCVAASSSPAGVYDINIGLGGLEATNYSFSFVHGHLTVSKETVTIEYTGDNFVYTAGPTITTAPVRLAAHLTQEADGSPGDLTLARVCFKLFKFSNNSGVADVTVGGIPVDASGNALTIKSLAVDECWTVYVTIEPDNQYWTEDEIEMSSVTVAPGSNDKRVTGGGWIPDSQSVNGKGNFGFTVNFQKSGSPKGNSLYLFRGTDGYNYRVKSNSWQGGGLTFFDDGWKARFSGKCVVQKIDRNTGLVVESWGNYRFTVDIWDGDLKSPRTFDRYAMTIIRDNGTVWRQIGDPASPTQLGGGNVTIHSGKTMLAMIPALPLLLGAPACLLGRRKRAVSGSAR